METLLMITHEVKDYDTWKEGFDSGAPMRDQAGLKLRGVYRSVDNQNVVTVITEAPNADVARAIANNQDLRADMQRVGVISVPEFMIVSSSN